MGGLGASMGRRGTEGRPGPAAGAVVTTLPSLHFSFCSLLHLFTIQQVPWGLVQGQPSTKPAPATPAWAACLGRCGTPGTPALPGAGVKAAVGRAIQGPEGRAGAWEAGWRSFCSAGRAESPRAQKLLPGGTEGETEAAWAGSGRKGRRVGSAVVRQDSGSEVRALAGALTAGPRPGSRSLRPGPAGRRAPERRGGRQRSTLCSAHGGGQAGAAVPESLEPGAAGAALCPPLNPATHRGTSRPGRPHRIRGELGPERQAAPAVAGVGSWRSDCKGHETCPRACG